MKLKTDVGLGYGRRIVFETYRDRVATEIWKSLPDIRGVVVVSRDPPAPAAPAAPVRMVTRWTGGGEIPGILRSIISDEMLSWTAYDVWDEGRFTCDWRIDAHPAVQVSGRNTFLPEGPGTLIEIRGELHVDVKKLTGVPGWMGGAIGAALEAFLASRTEPNIVAVVRGLDRYLAAAAAPPVPAPVR